MNECLCLGDQEFIQIGADPDTLLNYASAGAIRNLVNMGRENHNIRCDILKTDGSISNINTIRDGKLDFGFAHGDHS